MAKEPQRKTTSKSQPKKAKSAKRPGKQKQTSPKAMADNATTRDGKLDRELLAAEISEAMRAHKRSGPKPKKLSPAYQQAAMLCGTGMKACDVAERLGISANEISTLRYGMDERSKHWQRLEMDAQTYAITALLSQALGTMGHLMEHGKELTQVGTVREVNALVRNMAAIATDRDKIRLERDRLALQREQAEAAQKQAETSPGIIILPAKQPLIRPADE